MTADSPIETIERIRGEMVPDLRQFRPECRLTLPHSSRRPCMRHPRGGTAARKNSAMQCERFAPVSRRRGNRSIRRSSRAEGCNIITFSITARPLLSSDGP